MPAPNLARTRASLVAPRDDPRWAYLLVNLSVLLWSTNFMLGRLLRDQIGPFTLTGARFTVAGLIFLALVARSPAILPEPGRLWTLLVAMAFTGVFGFGFLLYSGLDYTSVTNASLINGTAPLIVGLLSTVFLGERFTRRSLVGAIISLTGVAVIVSRGSIEVLRQQQLNLGDVLVLTAVVAWAVYSVISRIVTRTYPVLAATIVSTWMGLPMLYPAAAIEWQTRPPVLSAVVLVSILYIGVFPSVAAYLAWNESVHRVGPAKMTAFFNMLPVFGSLLGVLLLGEPFGLPQAAGGALVIGGSLSSVWNDLWTRPEAG